MRYFQRTENTVKERGHYLIHIIDYTSNLVITLVKLGSFLGISSLFDPCASLLFNQRLYKVSSRAYNDWKLVGIGLEGEPG